MLCTSLFVLGDVFERLSTHSTHVLLFVVMHFSDVSTCVARCEYLTTIATPPLVGAHHFYIRILRREIDIINISLPQVEPIYRTQTQANIIRSHYNIHEL